MKTKEYAIKCGGEAKRFVENSKLDENNKNINYIKHWIHSAQYFIKNKEEIGEIDIRKYLEFEKRRRKEDE